MVIVALAAAATASLGAGTAALVVQRQQLARLHSIVNEKGCDIADLIHHVRALQCKAIEFAEMPKAMSAKRRRVQEATEKEIQKLQARYAMSGEHLANLSEKCDKSDKQVADLHETFQDVPKLVPELMSLQQKQSATLEKISAQTGEQIQSLQEQMQEDIAALKEEFSEASSLLTRALVRNADLEKRIEAWESSQCGCFSFSLWKRK